MKKLIEIALDYLLPRFCIYCDTEGNNICETCINNFEYIQNKKCHVCNQSIDEHTSHKQCKSSTLLDGVLAAVNYNAAAKKALKELKYNYYSDFAKDLGRILKKTYPSNYFQAEVVTAVPLHRSKKWKRGFNQAELLAKNLDIKYEELLTRQVKTKSQVTFNREERLRNLKGVFIPKSNINYQKVLLVDDVMTTGATLENCAKALKLSGVKEVYALVWARA